MHGRYDMICPAEQAFRLHQALPYSQLNIVRDAGNAQQALGIMDNLVKETSAFALKLV
jgi:proline iminopeptidase